LYRFGAPLPLKLGTAAKWQKSGKWNKQIVKMPGCRRCREHSKALHTVIF